MVSLANSVGTVPVKKFVLMRPTVSRLMSPNDVGIVPTNPFELI